MSRRFWPVAGVVAVLAILMTCSENGPAGGSRSISLKAYVCDTSGVDTSIISSASGICSPDSVAGVVPGVRITFRGIVTGNASGLTQIWDFGDRKASVVVPDSIVEHSYDSGGTYHAVFTVTGSGTVVTDTVIVKVIKLLPGLVSGCVIQKGRKGHGGIQVRFIRSDSVWVPPTYTDITGRFLSPAQLTTCNYSVIIADTVHREYGADTVNSLSVILGHPDTLDTVMLKDTTMPRISGLQPDTVDSAHIAVIRASFADAGSGVAPASLRLTVDGVAVQPDTVDSNRLVLRDSLPGRHAVTAFIADSAGNGDSAAWYFTFVNIGTIPAPVIVHPAADSDTVTSADTLRWSASASPVGRPIGYRVRLKSGSGNFADLPAAIADTFVALPKYDSLSAALMVQARDVDGDTSAWSVPRFMFLKKP